MNWVDILVLVILVVAGYKGFKSGLVRMGVFLVVMGIGLALSSRLTQPISNLLPSMSENDRVQSIIVFLVLIIALIIGAEIINRVLVTIIKFVPLGGLANNLAGTAIGLIVGLVIMSALLAGMQKFPFGSIQEDIDSSSTGSFLADNFDTVIRGFKLIPSDWDQDIKDRMGALKNQAIFLSPTEH